eukprot:1341315-Amorphochlora_amoeboformis.AAC.2
MLRWVISSRGSDVHLYAYTYNLIYNSKTCIPQRVPAGPRSSAPARRHKNNHNAATIGSDLTNTRAHSHATVASHGVGTPPQATVRVRERPLRTMDDGSERRLGCGGC